MAFKFRSKSSLPITNKSNISGQIVNDTGGMSHGGKMPGMLPKFTNAQMNKLVKEFPSWLKDKSGPNQLPGIYQGVLGQVQLQPSLNLDSQKLTNGQKFLLANKSQQQQIDYMNRFTDTERVHQLLSASQLSDDTLATIWAHVNQTFPGKLTNREVCFALALIAIFQRLGEDESVSQTLKRDPFSLVRAEKKPPVPVLYPSSRASRHLPSPINRVSCSPISSSKSTPDKLSGSASSSALLVDFGDGDETVQEGLKQANCNNSVTIVKSSEKSKLENTNVILSFNQDCTNFIGRADKPLNLIDIIDGDNFEIELFKLTQMWLKFLSAMRTIFKRSFDILNVENSRQSSIEALKSKPGKQFIRHLCLCYPIAHNIKFKIEQLSKMRLPESEEKVSDVNLVKGQYKLLDKNYVTKVDDLMNSINEYWAVLINLFHESGQTKFIELIMDGLNYKQPTVTSKTIDGLSNELNGLGRPNVCSICHTNFFLTNSTNTAGSFGESSATDDLDSDDLDLIGDQVELISEDQQYYYHARCANFWLNNVDSTGLPSSKKSENNILCPA